MTASPSLDFQQARSCMVDGQIRPNRVRDPRIIDALRSLPREHFLPPRLAHLAYADDDVPLGGGRVLLAPLLIARLVMLALQGEAGASGAGRALVVASGTGYGAALLAACGVAVTALEEDAELLAIADAALARLPPSAGGKVTQVRGPLPAGWPAEAPYDVILIEGAVRSIPPAIGSQVRAPGGRVVTVLAPPGGACQAVLAQPSVGGLRCQAEFDCGTPLIPALLPQPGFIF